MSERIFHWPTRIYYEDTDAGGVVYHTAYLRFMERTRTEWLRSLGFEQDRLVKEEGVLFVVHTLQLTYRKPARFNDQVVVGLQLTALKRASLSFSQAILRGDDQELLCQGSVDVACVKATTFRPFPIPLSLRMKLSSTMS